MSRTVDTTVKAPQTVQCSLQGDFLTEHNESALCRREYAVQRSSGSGAGQQVDGRCCRSAREVGRSSTGASGYT